MSPTIVKNNTTVDFDDLERLDEGQFLNDNLIGFYLRYLEYNFERKHPEKAKKVYWFNTYFFASLTPASKGRRGINYEAVRKWTRSIDIFSYDYAVVPINEQAHWYVAIICNLRALNRAPERGDDRMSSSPHLQSVADEEEVDEVLAVQQYETITVLQDVQEGKSNGSSGAEDARESLQELHLDEEQNTNGYEIQVQIGEKDELLCTSKPSSITGDISESIEDAETIVVKNVASPKASSSQKRGKRKSTPRIFDPRQPAIITFDSLGLSHPATTRALKDYLLEEAKDKRGMELDDAQIKGITAKQIKQQDNYCDCGLFLLGYLEKFVDNPTVFVANTLQRLYDTEKDWQQLNPSALRASIRELLQGLHAQQEGSRTVVKEKSPDRASSITTAQTQTDVPIEPNNPVLKAPLEPTSVRKAVKHTEQSRSRSSANVGARSTVEGLEDFLEIADPEPESPLLVTGPSPQYITLDGTQDVIPYAHMEDELPRVIPDSQPEELSFRDEPGANTATEKDAQEVSSIEPEVLIPSTPERNAQSANFSDHDPISPSTPGRSTRKSKRARFK
jgi:sentrin-specific protease 7